MAARNYALTSSMDALKSLLDKLVADGKPIGFDVETGYSGPDRLKGALAVDWDQQFVSGFSLTNSTQWARYVAVAHDHDSGQNLPEEKVWELVKPVLEELPVVAHNMKFEVRNLRALDRKGRGPRIDINVADDSMIQSYVLSEYPKHGLKFLVKEVFNYDQAEISSLFPGATQKQLKMLRFNTLELTPEVVSYACEDAVWTLALRDQFDNRVQTTRKFIYDLELRTLDLLADMEDAGHAVDWDAIKEAYTEGVPFLDHMVTAARQSLGELADADLSTLNFNSAPQMRKVLYEDLQLPYTRMTKGGKKAEPQPSTDKIALESLSRQYPAIKKILESREVKNLTNRMKKWLEEYNTGWDNRVHANFNQVVVGSGRFSANDPAIQQLPKKWLWTVFTKVLTKNSEHMAQVRERAEHGRHYWEGNFRNFLRADVGCYLLGFDYSQIELRMLAGLSQEPALLEAFAEGKDMHSVTAAMMLDKELEDVTEADRAIGKTQNFALLYQMGVKSLAERLALSMDEAQRLYDMYFEKFTKVRDWMSDAKNKGLAYGYIETYFGRKWTLWDLKSHSRAMQGKGERLTINAPVQGSAADYMKISMLRAQEALKAKGWWQTKVWMINNLHDALTFEADNSIDPAELREVLQPAVVWPLEGFPQIVADWELGQLWGSATKWKDEKVAFVDGVWEVVKESDESAPEEDEDIFEEDPTGMPEPDFDWESAQPQYFLPEEEEPEEREAPAVLVVKTTSMPDAVGFERFMEMVKGNQGSTTVRLCTPEGEVMLEKYPTSLSPEHQGRVSMVLGGASVFYEESVDVAAIGEGLTL